jgi:ribosomal protein S18 acetylase RimI-like enzyme
MKFREPNIMDIYSIYLCNKKCLPIYYNLTDYLYFLFSNDTIILIAEDVSNNKIDFCGFILAKLMQPFIHILSFCVNKKYRRKGIGKKLLTKLEQLVIKRSCKIKKISLYVHTENKDGILFYKKCGFYKIKTLKNYYQGSLKKTKTQDAYRLEKKI